MTGPLPMALALLALLVLVALAHRLGFSASGKLTGPDHAAALAQGLPGGFDPVEIILSRDSRGALLREANGRVAIVVPVGAHFFVRSAAEHWRVRMATSGRLEVRGGDLSAQLDLGDQSARWVAILDAAASGRP